MHSRTFKTLSATKDISARVRPFFFPDLFSFRPFLCRALLLRRHFLSNNLSSHPTFSLLLEDKRNKLAINSACKVNLDSFPSKVSFPGPIFPSIRIEK